MSDLVSGPAIQAGKAAGLLEFADWVVTKGYGSNAAWTPLKSAVRQVFSTLEDGSYDELDVRSLDLDDYLSRYELKARGKLKAESIQSYASRFRRAVESYREFLDTGQPPRASRQRGARAEGAESPRTKVRRSPAQSAANARATRDSLAFQAAERDEPVDRLIDYPFPLSSGQVALLRLPLRLERGDAERLAAFVRTLVLEAQRELMPASEPAS